VRATSRAIIERRDLEAQAIRDRVYIGGLLRNINSRDGDPGPTIDLLLDDSAKIDELRDLLRKDER